MSVIFCCNKLLRLFNKEREKKIKIVEVPFFFAISLRCLLDFGVGVGEMKMPDKNKEIYENVNRLTIDREKVNVFIFCIINCFFFTALKLKYWKKVLIRHYLLQN